MTDYDNTNRGTLFKNKRKETDRHPDYTGSINIGGEEYFLDAWLKTAQKSGERFMSLSVKKKNRQPETASRQHDPQHGSAGFDDEIPF